MQNIVCAIERCGYRSKSGFCLNRLVSITIEGQCSTLLKRGWNQKKEDWELSTYQPREPDQCAMEIGTKED